MQQDQDSHPSPQPFHFFLDLDSGYLPSTLADPDYSDFQNLFELSFPAASLINQDDQGSSSVSASCYTQEALAHSAHSQSLAPQVAVEAHQTTMSSNCESDSEPEANTKQPIEHNTKSSVRKNAPRSFGNWLKKELKKLGHSSAYQTALMGDSHSISLNPSCKLFLSLLCFRLRVILSGFNILEVLYRVCSAKILKKPAAIQGEWKDYLNRTIEDLNKALECDSESQIKDSGRYHKK